jgi:hypothetical protein
MDLTLTSKACDCGVHVSFDCADIIKIGLEHAHFVVLVNFFSSFETYKKLLIMGPNNTKNSSLKCDFSYLIINNIVRILFLL